MDGHLPNGFSSSAFKTMNPPKPTNLVTEVPAPIIIDHLDELPALVPV